MLLFSINQNFENTTDSQPIKKFSFDSYMSGFNVYNHFWALILAKKVQNVWAFNDELIFNNLHLRCLRES